MKRLIIKTNEWWDNTPEPIRTLEFCFLFIPALIALILVKYLVFGRGEFSTILLFAAVAMFVSTWRMLYWIFTRRIEMNEMNDKSGGVGKYKDTKTEVVLAKLDELLVSRSSQKDTLKLTERLIKQGLECVNGFPKRWVVRDANSDVCYYLTDRHKKDVYPVSGTAQGESNGNLAFVPHDIDCTYEITIDEFYYALSLSVKQAKESNND